MKKPRFTVEMQDEAEEVLRKHLPSGSGIDCKWEFTWLPTRVVCTNAYHCMNEGGYYCGYADFSLSLYYKKPVSDFKLKFHGSQSHTLNKKHFLRDYLEDLFHYTLVNEKDNPIQFMNCFAGRMPVEVIY